MAVATEDKSRLILEQINWDSRVIGADIQVHTIDGKVILTGTADNEVARRAAEEVAIHFPGISQVENKILLVPPYSKHPHVDSDAELREKILYALELNGNIDESSMFPFNSSAYKIFSLSSASESTWKHR